MATLQKDVLYPGDYHLPDGRIFRCRVADVPHYRRRLLDMMNAGLSIPVSWEHQRGAVPMSRVDHEQALADRTRNVLGRVSDVIVDSAACVELKLFIPSEDDARRLPAVGFVSPKIEWDFRDSTGRVWPGPSITHVAVTARPIQHLQKPFALSADDVLGLSSTTFAPVTLSLDSRSRNMPRKTIIMSEPDKKVIAKFLDRNNIDVDSFMLSIENGVAPAPAAPVAPAGPPIDFPRITQGLQDMGFMLNFDEGEDVNAESFLRKLQAAIVDEDSQAGGKVTEAPMPMMMSNAKASDDEVASWLTKGGYKKPSVRLARGTMNEEDKLADYLTRGRYSGRRPAG